MVNTITKEKKLKNYIPIDDGGSSYTTNSNESLYFI